MPRTFCGSLRAGEVPGGAGQCLGSQTTAGQLPGFQRLAGFAGHCPLLSQSARASRSRICPPPMPICASPPATGTSWCGCARPSPTAFTATWTGSFPAFSIRPKSGLRPFCQASLDLMVERFSPAQLSRRPRQALAAVAGPPERGGAQNRGPPTQAIGQRTAAGPAPEQTLMLQRTLSQLVELYRGLEKSITSAGPRGRLLAGAHPGSAAHLHRRLWRYPGGGLDGRTGTAHASGRRCAGSAPMPAWCPEANKPAARTRNRSSGRCSSAATNASRMSCCRPWKRFVSTVQKICAEPLKNWTRGGLIPSLRWPNDWCA